MTKAERLVRQVDYLDDRQEFEPAWNALLSELPEGIRLYAITIEDKRISVLGAAPGARTVAFPTLNPARDSFDYLSFRLDEVDLTKLPEVKKNALEAFGATGVEVTDISGKKSLSVRGGAASEVLWHVTARFPGTPASRFGPFPEMDELGVAQVRVDGTVVRVQLPRRLRAPIDWFSGDGLILALREIGATSRSRCAAPRGQGR